MRRIDKSSASSISSFRDLVVWQRAMQLCKAVYEATADFPEDERFGLVSQMRRAAVSIPSNIAEGQGRRVGKDFQRFLGIARGSLRELETQWLIAEQLGLVSQVAVRSSQSLINEVGRMLSVLLRRLSEDQQ